MGWVQKDPAHRGGALPAPRDRPSRRLGVIPSLPVLWPGSARAAPCLSGEAPLAGGGFPTKASGQAPREQPASRGGADGSSVHVIALVLWLFAAFAACAILLILGQALARESGLDALARIAHERSARHRRTRPDASEQGVQEESGCPDLNRGPPRPERGALTKLRYSPSAG